MDPWTISRLGKIRQEEIVDWALLQQQHNVEYREWKLPNVLGFIRQHISKFKQPRAENFNTAASASNS